MYKHFLLCFLLLSCFLLQAQTGVILLEGRYQGKNLYVSNPYVGTGFCTKKVLVNEKEVAFEDSSSAYEIDLKNLGYKLGDSLTIKIFHKDDCQPRIMYEFHTPKSNFDVISIEISPEGILKWTTKDEDGKLPFIIEQFRWLKWVKVGEAEGKGGMGENHYEYKVVFHSDTNKFRIRQVEYLTRPRPHVSKPVEIVSTVETPTFCIDNAKRKIEFSLETMYQLYDKDGSIVRKGLGKTINCSELKKGIYFLDYDNKTTEVLFR
jgi:hypothetical protein